VRQQFAKRKHKTKKNSPEDEKHDSQCARSGQRDDAEFERNEVGVNVHVNNSQQKKRNKTKQKTNSPEYEEHDSHCAQSGERDDADFIGEETDGDGDDDWRIDHPVEEETVVGQTLTVGANQV
jgi:hypothetical protein